MRGAVRFTENGKTSALPRVSTTKARLLRANARVSTATRAPAESLILGERPGQLLSGSAAGLSGPA